MAVFGQQIWEHGFSKSAVGLLVLTVLFNSTVLPRS